MFANEFGETTSYINNARNRKTSKKHIIWSEEVEGFYKQLYTLHGKEIFEYVTQKYFI